MQVLITKLRYIYLPFLVIAIVCITGYTFLNWLLIVKMELINVNETYINFGVPFVLPWIPIIIWLRPHIKQLKLKQKSGKDSVDFYVFIVSFAICVPTIIAQEYLKTATGKLTQLENAAQIKQHPKTKYYTIKNFYIDKNQIRISRNVEVSGKYNEHLDFYIYVVCPIYAKPNSIASAKHKPILKKPVNNQPLIIINGKLAEQSLAELDTNNIKSIQILKNPAATAIFGDRAKNGAILIKTKKAIQEQGSDINDNAKRNPEAWLGVKYNTQVSNHLSDDDKEQAYQDFNKDSFEKFKQANLNNFQYLDRIGVNDSHKGYEKAIQPGASLPTQQSPIIFEAVNEPFEARNGNKLPWIFGSFGIGAGVFLIMILIPGIRNESVFHKQAETISVKALFKDELLFFIPREGFFVTPILVDVNILVFIAMVAAGWGFMQFDTQSLLTWGANYAPYTEHNQWWRLLTNIFMHGGLMHVLMNMFSLVFIGMFLEPILGYKRYLMMYLVTGVIASLTSMLWHPVISVGASGAIFGLFGAFAALLTTPLFPAEAKKAFAKTVGIFIGYNLLLGLAGGVDNAAHIGGLLAGVLCGYGLYPFLKQQADHYESLTNINTNPTAEESNMFDKV